MKIIKHSLEDLEVVVADCQATHNDPKKAEVFEIGWATTKASDSFSTDRFEKKTESFLLKLPDSKKISNPIKKITGIQDEDLFTAPSLTKIWPKLLAASHATAVRNGMSLCPLIIHYARYETPFLESFHKQYNPDIPFPFHIICTHQIIKQLFPGLPRKGLRAASGYFGLSLPETRRSRHHVLGTGFIWSNIVKLLKKQEYLSSFDDLLKWMKIYSSSDNHSKSPREYPMAKNYKQDLPALPGIYRMLRSNGDLLYIGKAKSLKQRVNSYFHQKGKHSEHILDMLSQAKSLTYSVTKTALEAALKESDEIKVFAPPFNIALRLSEDGPLFSTKDLKRFNKKPDQQFRIGPLPSKKHIEPLSFIMDILNGKISSITPEIIKKTLTTPEEYSPDQHIFLKGLKEFKKQNNNLLIKPVTFQILMKMGSIFWKENLNKQAERRTQAEAKKDLAVIKPDLPNKKKKTQSVNWTPEKLTKTLSHIIRIGTFQIRRSRWLSLLTESALIWEKQKGETGEVNLVVMKSGWPNFEDPNLFPKKEPLPIGNGKSFLTKQNYFDVYTYDRMRIFTTEIRRILEEDRFIRLQLGPKLLLDSEQVNEILKWI